MKTETLMMMRDEVREWTVRKGWRENPEIPERTMGEELALLQTELSEATEAFRIMGLDRWVGDLSLDFMVIPEGSWDYLNMKPEGVGSELADTLIRLLDNYAHRGMTPEPHVIFPLKTHVRFSDDISALQALVGDIHIKWYFDGYGLMDDKVRNRILKEQYDKVLSVLIFTAEHYGFDIWAEYRAKMDYNETRSHRHGGKKL